jgi:hypothetical protein
MVSAAHAGKRKGVNPTHLSKILKILEKTVERTLSVVSQSSKRTDGVPRWIVELGRVDTEMMYDPSDPVIDESVFELKDWTSIDYFSIQHRARRDQIRSANIAS